MNKNLQKRIYTSILLFIFTILFILINKFLFLLAILGILSLCVVEWHKLNHNYFKRKKIKYNLILAIGIVYAFIVLFILVDLRGDNLENATFLIFILSICATSDIGGYIFGKFIGGKKLIKISPKKTIAGSAGSFILSILPLFLFNFQISFKNIFFCLIISLSCQLGDLIISYFKRLNKIKDTGKILPGHGGLLDRLDGIIFALPIAYILTILLII